MVVLMQAERIPVGPCEAKQIRERRVNEHLSEVRRAVHDGEWVVALGEVESLSDELAAIVELDAGEKPTVRTLTIKAAELREGDGIKAKGAPAWSTIKRVLRAGDADKDKGLVPQVTAVVDWGRIIYNADEDVEVNRRQRDGDQS